MFLPSFIVTCYYNNVEKLGVVRENLCNIYLCNKIVGNAVLARKFSFAKKKLKIR